MGRIRRWKMASEASSALNAGTAAAVRQRAIRSARDIAFISRSEMPTLDLLRFGGDNQVRQARLGPRSGIGMDHVLRPGPVELSRGELQLGFGFGDVAGGDRLADLADLGL